MTRKMVEIGRYGGADVLVVWSVHGTECAPVWNHDGSGMTTLIVVRPYAEEKGKRFSLQHESFRSHTERPSSQPVSEDYHGHQGLRTLSL